MNLWAHQCQALDEMERGESQSTCVTSPTGGGKSLIMFERMIGRGVPAVLYTNRRMLMDQLSTNLLSKGIQHGIRAAGHEPQEANIQLCMIQTEVSRSLRSHELHKASEVYIDEAHNNKAGTAQAIIDWHKEHGAKVWGFTATPLGVDHLYDDLIIAGTNSELRKCGALIPAYTYGPDEPDTRWVGKVNVTEGECGLQKSKRMEYVHRVFGRVVEWYHKLNPDQKPSLLFAPGVAESKWLAQHLTSRGISAAHIDGENIWIDGEEHDSTTEMRDQISSASRYGDVKIVCNRFVLREGIDWPWVAHGIFATVFGSLTAYIQAGGRLLRNHESLDHVVIQDHGGSWHRHGSLNSDRQWQLTSTDRIVQGLREHAIREKKEPEPIVCVKCGRCRLSGVKCSQCGYRYERKSRMILQRDGSLREMKGDIFRKRRYLDEDEKVRRDWASRVKAIKRSQKPTVRRMTFAQLEATFARDHNWQYAPRTLPLMPVAEQDWYRPIRDVDNLT